MKDRIRAAFRDFGRGEPGTLVALLAPDVAYTVIGTTALSGTLHGPDQVLTRLLRPLAAALATPLALEIVSTTAEGDRVVVEARGRATLVSGAPYDNTYCFVFRFNDAGQIQYLTEHWNTWHAYRQLFNNFEVEPAHPLD